MILLGIDLGTKTGFCVANVGSSKITNMLSGVQDFTKEDKARGLLYNDFEKWLNLTITTFGPEIAIAERPHHRGGESTRKLVGLFSIFEKVCESRGVKYADVHTGTLKKVCCGHGKAGKEEVKKFVSSIFDQVPEKGKRFASRDLFEDEADAMAVCYYGAVEFCDFGKRKMKRRNKMAKDKKKKKKSMRIGDEKIRLKTKNQKKFAKEYKKFIEAYGEMGVDIIKLFNDTKSAAPALRKKLMAVKNGAQELRKLALDIQKDI